MSVTEKSYFISVSKKIAKQDRGDEELQDFVVDYNELEPLNYEANCKEYKEKLLEGYSGNGSKKLLLEKFCLQFLEDQYHTQIHGWVDKISQRQVLIGLKNALNCPKAEEDEILDAAAGIKHEFFLVIHSIDRLISNNSRIKLTLTRFIMASPKIHLIASVDHINSALLWNLQESGILKLLWLNFPTFQSYSFERKLARASVKQIMGYNKYADQELTLAAIKRVYGNLNQNAQKIFILILQFFMNASKTRKTRRAKVDKEETDSENEERPVHKISDDTRPLEGYPLNQLVVDCMDEFIVSSSATLQAQLREFLDHGLCSLKTGRDGAEYVDLLVDCRTIPKLIRELQLTD